MVSSERLPKTRLKLTPPALNCDGLREQRRCARIPFVHSRSTAQLSRTSLGGPALPSVVRSDLQGEMRRFHFPLLALQWLSVAACTDATAPHPALLTRIHRASLDSTKVLTVAFTLTNLGQYNVQIPACAGDAIPEWQRLEDGTWGRVFGGPDACPAPALFRGLISIAPGASLHGTDGFWESEPGIYRIVWSYEVNGVPRVLSQPFTVE